MTMLTCPPIEGDRVQSIYATLDIWLRSDALAALVQAFGTHAPSDLPLPTLAAWFLDFSERWDYRRQQQTALAHDTGERSRWLITHSFLTETQRDLTRAAAIQLGLVGQEHPSKTAYDFALVLGGARLSNLLRPQYAAYLINERSRKFDAIALLASSRPVSVTERVATDTYAPEAKTEFDLITKGAEQAFGIMPSFSEEHSNEQNGNTSWIIRRYDSIGAFPPIVALCAPSSEPELRRANSSDTFEFFFDRIQVLHGASILLITSQIYVPYQQLEAIQTLALPHNVIVETVGFPSEWGRNLPGMNEPENYLQEIRSTILSANRFLAAFPR